MYVHKSFFIMSQNEKTNIKLEQESGGCRSCSGEHDHESKTEHSHDEHDHTHGEENFSLKRELIPVVVVSILLVGGLIFEEQLHNTPYSLGEYLVFIPAYLLSGWGALKTAGKNILRGRIFD